MRAMMHGAWQGLNLAALRLRMRTSGQIKGAFNIMKDE